nr:MAG TPA: hypothetical protein [Caudoviricetes sp.]
MSRAGLTAGETRRSAPLFVPRQTGEHEDLMLWRMLGIIFVRSRK